VSDTLDGARAEIEKMVAAMPEAALRAAEPAMEAAVLFLHGELPQYPGQPDGSSYIRTNELGRRWTEQVERARDVVLGEIGTNLEYAPWAGGPSFPGEEIGGRTMYQAKAHVGRWWQFGSVMDASADGAWVAFSEEFWKGFGK
jgi:hypothetical protein